MRFCVKIGLKYTFLFWTVALALCGCGGNELGTVATAGAEYVPLAIGKAMTYDVDTIYYDPQPGNVVKIDTVRWEMREVIADTFRNSSDETVYRIERFVRKKGETAWRITNVFGATINKTCFLRQEGNFRFIKFPIPVGLRDDWDGNVLIDPSVNIEVTGDRIEPFSKKWTYQALSLAKPEKIGTRDYTEVLTVRAQSDTRILTERRYQLEKYAKGVGLVYQELWILDTQKLDAAIAWEKKAEKGFILKMTLTGF